MYPKNAASPERIAVGAVVLIADGTVQTSGVSITVTPQGGTSGAGGGTTSYEQGVVCYLPTQAETNYTSFIVTAYKASCIPAAVTVVTTASATAGKVVLSGETHTSAVIPTVSTLTGHTAQTGDSYAVVTNGTYGLSAIETLVDGIETTLGTPAGASMSADILAIDNFVDGIESTLAAGVTVTTNNDKTGYALSAAGVDAVWDELLSGHAVSGSAGEALSAAGTAGDPWTTALPGAYGAGTAGKIIGDNINATISSRASQTSLDTVDDLLDTEVAAIKTVVDSILVDTAEIGAAGAGLTALATAAALSTAQADLNTITGADGVTLATAQPSITFQPITITAGDAINNITLAGSGTSDGIAFTRIGSGNPFDANFAAQIQSECNDAIVAYDPATGTEAAAIKSDTAAILIDTTEIGAAGAGLTALATQTSVNDLPTNAELATALDALPTAAENATAVLTTQMTESYRADGAAPTLAQAQCETLAHLGESSISGTTKTIKKVDGATTAATFTLNDATTPTSITRAT